MSSYPSKLVIFEAWAKAMRQGATVGKPHYGKTRRGPRSSRRGRKRRFTRTQRD